MRTSLVELLESKPVLLADGATGTNYMERGLGPGEPPELWNVEHADRVIGLHQDFVDAGADIILTNTFGCTRNRLALHKAESRVHELASAAARLARQVADASPRPLVVAGSVGPLGELFEPLGALTHDTAVASFREQIEGLRDGGADVAWIETMSSVEEVRAAAQAAIDVAMGANCGVGASDILVSLLGMSGAAADKVYISKGNCGVPQFQGADIVYSGTTEVMGTYAGLAMAAGARIIGGCCGTSPAHLAAMRASVDNTPIGDRPSIDDIVAKIGPLTNAAPNAASGEGRERSRGRRS
jgi:5-methyltetrahydrofolate--homocysteine methyltransferase